MQFISLTYSLLECKLHYILDREFFSVLFNAVPLRARTMYCRCSLNICWMNEMKSWTFIFAMGQSILFYDWWAPKRNHFFPNSFKLHIKYLIDVPLVWEMRYAQDWSQSVKLPCGLIVPSGLCSCSEGTLCSLEVLMVHNPAVFIDSRLVSHTPWLLQR